MTTLRHRPSSGLWLTVVYSRLRYVAVSTFSVIGIGIARTLIATNECENHHAIHRSILVSPSSPGPIQNSAHIDIHSESAALGYLLLAGRSELAETPVMSVYVRNYLDPAAGDD
jgi:hypothetical protein